jgi:uncharacterized protein
MKPRPARCLWILASGCWLWVAGCSLPTAQTDPTKFYVLAAPAAAPAPTANAPAIRLRPVELASYLRGRPMIVRRSENEIEFRDFARWGEPLDQGIARVLGDGLIARGAASAVQVGAIRPSESTDVRYELSLRVLACEGGAGGTVNFRAVWELASVGDNGAPVAHGDFHPLNLRWDGKHEASLASALSEAIAGLAGEIAAGLKK